MKQVHCLLFLLASLFVFPATGYGTVEVPVFEETIRLQSFAPSFKSYSFPAMAGPATLTVTDETSPEPSGQSVIIYLLVVNGHILEDLLDLNPAGPLVTTNIDLKGGGNTLEIIYSGIPGEEMRVRLSQHVDADGAGILGPGGGEVRVTDLGSEVQGVRVTAGENAIGKATMVKIYSTPRGKHFPLFPPYLEVLSPIAVFESSSPLDGSVNICFPAVDFEGEGLDLYSPHPEGDGWVAAQAGISTRPEEGEICASVDGMGTFALTARSDCSAPGTRYFDFFADPNCSQKWERALYLSFVNPHLEPVASQVYTLAAGGLLITQDLVDAHNEVAERTGELEGLNGKHMVDILTRSGSEALLFEEELFGPDFSQVWHNALLEVTGGNGGDENGGVTIDETSLPVLEAFLGSSLPEELILRKKEFQLSNEFLSRYFHFGADEEMLKRDLGLDELSDRAGIVHALATRMGYPEDESASLYDAERVVHTIDRSLGVTYQLTRGFTSPEVSTSPPSGITGSSAILKGSVTTNGLATDTWFEWGTDSPFETHQRTAVISLLPGALEEDVTFSLTGLTPMTSYFYRLVASNDTEEVTGPETAFETTGDPPSIGRTWFDPSSPGSVTLSGLVNPNELPTEVWFEWGVDQSLSTFENTSPIPAGSAGTYQVISDSLAGLQEGTTHYFRVVASNGAGTERGAIASFIIPDLVVSAGAPTGIRGEGATLSGSVIHGEVPVDAWFEFSTDPTLKEFIRTPVHSLEGGGGVKSITHTLDGLRPNSTYYYRAAVSGGGQTKRSGIVGFSTTHSLTAVRITTLRWLPPEANMDGSALNDLAGFRLHFGSSSSDYTETIDVGMATSYSLTDLPPGTWYFAVTAYDTSGNESAYSNELGKKIF